MSGGVNHWVVLPVVVPLVVAALLLFRPGTAQGMQRAVGIASVLPSSPSPAS